MIYSPIWGVTFFPEIHYKTLQSCKVHDTLGQFFNRTGGGYMLQKVLESAMKEKGLGARKVGAILGVSHTTVLRAMRGEQIDLDTLIKIADWLKIRPSALLDSMGEADVESKIDVLVEAYPELQKVLADAAVAIENGQADPSIIKDIVAYAEYRIQSSGG
jgi:transcriptional regulator with XRE-family HTH domain